MESNDPFFYKKRQLMRNATEFFEDVNLPEPARINLITELEAVLAAMNDAEDLKEFESKDYDYCLYWEMEATKKYIGGKIFTALDKESKLSFLRKVKAVLSQYRISMKVGNTIYTVDILPYLKSTIHHVEEELDLLQSEGQPSKSERQPSKKVNRWNQMIAYYIDTCETLGKTLPSLKDLVDHSGIPRSTWDRHLHDDAFVVALRQKLQKKAGGVYAQKKGNESFLLKVESELVDRFVKYRNWRDTSFNEEKHRPPDRDTDPDEDFH